MAVTLWLCLSALLLGVPAANSLPTNSETTPEIPVILNEETTPEIPLILNEETTPEIPLILNEDGLPGSPERFMLEEYQRMKEEFFEMTNPTHIKGEELVESDILLTKEQRQLWTDRKAINSANYRWPTGSDGNVIVPYIFDDTQKVDTAAVQSAMDHWEEHTCVKFETASVLTAPHLRFIKSTGCWSYIGRIYFWSGQDISIGQYCNKLGTVAHEIGHALGFYHEQSRSDRDSYVHINASNYLSAKQVNFNMESDNNYGVSYDYKSIMHYGARYFTKNGGVTLATTYPLAQGLIGNRDGLSHYDKLLANTMYPCIEKWLEACNLAADPCQNDGYMGSNCKCVCPPGTSGSNCQTLNKGYIESFLPSCSENVTVEGAVTSPNYPSNYPRDVKCVKWIQAPSDCYTIQLTFNSFKMYPQSPYCSGGVQCCYFEILEIRTTDPSESSVYCGNMISPGTVFTSSNSEMMLYFVSRTYWNKGWTADVAFIPKDSCYTG